MRIHIKHITLTITAILVVAIPFCISAENKVKGIIFTGELAKKVYGYGGRTPLNIHIENGVISHIEALDNHESPQYFNRATTKIFPQFIGKSVSEAAEMQVDAVTGATYSSEAIIENIRLGLEEAKAQGLDKAPNKKKAKKITKHKK